jgi:hypothetical protein
MNRTSPALWTLAALPLLLAQAPATRDTASPKTRRERTLDYYRSEAKGYTIYRDASRREEAKLSREPVYVWTNSTSSGGQDGAVFVWTCQGRPEAIGTIFVQPPTGRREIIHELHSLSLSVLDVERQGAHTWTPEAPGITLTPIPDAPAPADSPRGRLVQMRTLAREFSGYTIDHNHKRWDLRFLSQPLYRYASTDPNVIDGAVLALVSSAGTDPEALLILEARRPAPGAEAVWQSGYARFTDRRLSIRHHDVEVFSAPPISFNTGREDVKHRYRLFSDRVVDPIDGDTNANKTGTPPAVNTEPPARKQP